MTQVAAIDCGTNSIRLLIAEVDPAAGTLTDRDRRMQIVRLGQGVDRTGRFAPEALERTFAACRSYAEVIAEHECERVRFVATSASRDVANREVFVAGVRTCLGVEPEVVSGAEEARLSFDGATRDLVGGDHPEPFLVVDIGGGSTEFVLGAAGADHRGAALAASVAAPAAVSVDVGCVRLTERHLHDDPPSAEQIAAARADVESAIERAAKVVPLRTAATLIGLAGSVTTVAAMALALPSYIPELIHHTRIAAPDVHAVADRLLTMTRAERGALAFMHPGRVDVIGAGALVLSCVVRAAGVDAVLVSEHDILDGIALRLAGADVGLG